MDEEFWKTLKDFETNLDELEEGDEVYIQYGNGDPLKTPFEVSGIDRDADQTQVSLNSKGQAKSRTIKLSRGIGKVGRFIDPSDGRGCRLWQKKTTSVKE